jgi:ribosomal protein S18 acetylase RimI-like enzyme
LIRRGWSGTLDILELRMDIRVFRPEDESAVLALWERCGLIRPWNDPRKDIARKLAVQPELFLVGLADHTIVATAMAGYEGHRGWVNYLAVAPERQRQGLGRSMMREVERLLHSAGCPKINLQIRDTNAEAMAFYSALGYKRDEVVSMGKRLETDRTDA